MNDKIFIILLLLLYSMPSKSNSPKDINYTLHFVEQEKQLSEVAKKYCKANYGLRFFLKAMRELNPAIEYQELTPGLAVRVPSDEKICRKKSWVIGAELASKSLKATDKNGRVARINTSSYISLLFAHELAWNNKNLSRFGVSFAHENYIENDRNLHNPSNYRSTIFLRHELTPRERIYAFEVGIFQETLLRNSGTRDIELSIIPVPYFGHGWKWNVEDFETVRVQAGLQANWLLPSSDAQMKLDAGYEVKGFFNFQVYHGDFSVYYSYARQDSDIYDNLFRIIGLTYAMRFW